MLKNIIITAFLFFYCTCVFANIDQITFQNESNEYLSISFENLRQTNCSNIRFGDLQPFGKIIIPLEKLRKELCGYRPKDCKLAIHTTKDCSASAISMLGIDFEKGIKWIIGEPRQQDHDAYYRTTIETDENKQLVHIAKSMAYVIQNTTTDIFIVSVNDVCTNKYYGFIWKTSLFLDSRYNSLWYLCKENINDCKITLHAYDNKEDCSRVPIANIFVDLDKGVKSIHNLADKKYKIDHKILRPHFLENIQIDKVN